MRRAPVLLLLLAATAAGAQEAGWHYSPLPGEGDRAALGCTSGSTPRAFACLAVRCEDDFTVGLHVHTSRAEADAGAWRLAVDGEAFELAAVPDGSPYRARVQGDVAPAIVALQQGSVAFLEPASGPALENPAIPLSGSLLAVGQALYFCAPKVPATDSTAPPASGNSARRPSRAGAPKRRRSVVTQTLGAKEETMSQAFVREGAGMPQVFPNRESAESAAELQRVIDGRDWRYEVRPRERGGYMVARLDKAGNFDAWVEA